MPLPITYNYSPTLQPSAWWQQAQTKIPGLPALPQMGTGAGAPTALAQNFSQYEPYQSALANLYQESMSAPNVGQQAQEGAPPSAIPTEVNNSALSELLASAAGVSRSSTTPLAGMPGQVGETMYGYGGMAPVLAQPTGPQAIQGWAVENPYGESTTPTGGSGLPPTPPPGSKTEAQAALDAMGATNPNAFAPPAGTSSPTPTTPSPGPGFIWNGYYWVWGVAGVSPPTGYVPGTGMPAAGG